MIQPAIFTHDETKEIVNILAYVHDPYYKAIAIIEDEHKNIKTAYLHQLKLTNNGIYFEQFKEIYINEFDPLKGLHRWK